MKKIKSVEELKKESEDIRKRVEDIAWDSGLSLFQHRLIELKYPLPNHLLPKI